MKTVNRNDVIMAIANSGADGITVRDLAETLGTTEPRIYTHVSRLCRDNMISKKRRMLSGRHWEAVYYSNTAAEEPVEQPTEQPANVRIDDPAPEASKHKPNQNHEGYNDPTATEAIKRMERYGGFMPGGIYKTTNGEAFLVLTTYPDTVLGYRIDFVPNATDTDSEVTWKVGPNSALVHTHRVCSVPFKRLLLGNMTKCPFESFRDILRKSPFNSCKKVEVPVEADNRGLTNRLEELLNENSDLRCSNKKMGDIISGLWDIVKVDNGLPDDAPIEEPELVDHMRRLQEAAVNWKSKCGEMSRDIQNANGTINSMVTALCDALEITKEDFLFTDVIERIERYKDLSEAPIDKDALGVSVADHERLKGERDVYKSIVDRIVEYWTA